MGHIQKASNALTRNQSRQGVGVAMFQNFVVQEFGHSAVICCPQYRSEADLDRMRQSTCLQKVIMLARICELLRAL